MKFALGEIRQMKQPLSTLLDKELPVKASWKLNKLIRFFDGELESIERFRIQLVKKYGVDVDGTTKVLEENMPNFVNELNDLLSEEVEYEYEPIPVDVLGDITISTRDMMSLEKIFT